MTAALFTASLCWSPAEAAELEDPDESIHGASVQDPHTAALRAEIGMATALPTLLVGGTAGLAPSIDLGLHMVTHAGLAYAVGLTGRWQAQVHPSRPEKANTFGLGLTLDESFYTVEQLAGIESLRSPFGNRVAATPQLLWSHPLPSGVILGGALGAETGLVRLQRVEDSEPLSPAERAFRPALDSGWAEIVASFPRRDGVFFVRLRAIVPVATEFHLLGYLPQIAVGRAWGVK